jgi:hypothetical protein
VGQSAELSDTLKRAGTTVQLQVVEGAGHSDTKIDQGLLQPAIDFVTQRLNAAAAGGALTGTAGNAVAGTPAAGNDPAPSQPQAEGLVPAAAPATGAATPRTEPVVAAATKVTEPQASAGDPPAVSSSGS